MFEKRSKTSKTTSKLDVQRFLCRGWKFHGLAYMWRHEKCTLHRSPSPSHVSIGRAHNWLLGPPPTSPIQADKKYMPLPTWELARVLSLFLHAIINGQWRYILDLHIKTSIPSSSSSLKSHGDMGIHPPP